MWQHAPPQTIFKNNNVWHKIRILQIISIFRGNFVQDIYMNVWNIKYVTTCPNLTVREIKNQEWVIHKLKLVHWHDWVSVNLDHVIIYYIWRSLSLFPCKYYWEVLHKQNELATYQGHNLILFSVIMFCK